MKKNAGKVIKKGKDPNGKSIETDEAEDMNDSANGGQTVSEFIISQCETGPKSSSSDKPSNDDLGNKEPSRELEARDAHSSKYVLDFQNRPILIGMAGVMMITFVAIVANFFEREPIAPQRSADVNAIRTTGTPPVRGVDLKGGEEIERSAKNGSESSDTIGFRTRQSDYDQRNLPITSGVIDSDVAGIDRVTPVGEGITSSGQDSLNDKIRSRQINALLARADYHLNELRLTVPQGQNALEIYRLVLDLEPDNTFARQGIERIAEKYRMLAEKVERKGDWIKALEYLDTGLGVMPASAAIREDIDRVTDIMDRRRSAQQDLVVARKAIKAREFEKAQARLDAAEAIFPSLPAIKRVRQRLVQRKSDLAALESPGAKRATRKMKKFTPGKSFRDRLGELGYGPEMVVISSGSFQMGDINGSGDDDEKPVHRVRIRRDFALGKYEVSFEDFDKFVDATGHRKPNDNGWGRGKRPVIDISWRDAKAYTNWLSKQTRMRYRLPSEAEWEYAARAGSKKDYWWGDQPSHDFANYGKDVCCDGHILGKDQWLYTAPIGSMPPNRFGLYEMAGNVWEWTGSVYDSVYRGTETKSQESNMQLARAARGGAWNIVPKGVRSAYRSGFPPGFRNNAHGFRVARDLN